ncbi:hypothetical protein WICMUC_002039 [Wickerhamomyces mucosus]|uniref:Sfi1 spindle body domain-containing protein n=1 Tax=Wickerhamomyces mucosus TaxID=1378264 RepID=A0A9P8PQ82_9ASCO|nr:hypothetical protein WICMUC_002039 [Wickerhamomyces mucosus]
MSGQNGDQLRHSIINQDTENLINSLTNIKLEDELSQPQPTLADPFLPDSTTNYMKTDISLLKDRLPPPTPTPTFLRTPSISPLHRSPVRRPNNNHNQNNHEVSETTMLIDSNYVPRTPIRRNVSGSSMDIIPSKIMEQSENITLDELYTLLSTLTNTPTNIHFKGILIKYLMILKEHKIDIDKDKLIITIYNQIKYHPFNDRSKLQTIIEIFLHEPSNEAIKLSNYLYFKDCQIQEKFLTSWVIKRRNLYDLQQSVKIWELYEKKKFFMKIVLKYQTISNDYESNAQAFYDIKAKIKVLDFWKYRLDENHSLGQISDDKNLNKFFNQWKLKIINNYEKAEDFYYQRLMKSVLKEWKLKLRIKSFPSTNLQKPFFNIWKTSVYNIQEFANDGKNLEFVFHVGFFFNKWKQHVDETLSKSQKLNDSKKILILQKFFKIWKYNLKLKLIENSVITRRNFFLKKFFMGKMKSTLTHLELLKKFEHTQEKRILRNNLKIWKAQMNLRNKLVDLNFSNVTVLRRYFQNWRLITKLKIYNENGNEFLLNKTFIQWNDLSNLHSLEHEFVEEHIVKKYFAKWDSRTRVLDDRLGLSQDALNQFTKVTFLNNWRRSLQEMESKQIKGDLLIKTKFFNKLKSKIQYNKSLSVKANNFFDNESTRFASKTIISKWINKYESKIENRLALKLETFEKDRGFGVKTTVFNLWNKKCLLYLSKEHEFHETVLKESLLGPIFTTWIDKYNYHKSLELQANEFNNANLISTGFSKFQHMLVKIEELNLRNEQFFEDQDLTIIQKYLNDWNLKVLKQKRDNETIRSFQKRWNRAHLRAIMSLWRVKSQNVQDSDESFSYSGAEDFDEEGESPTKYKSKFQSLLPTETPRKSPFVHLNSISKSTGGGGIPGSARIKRKRIEALKSHYGQIKFAIPSPMSTSKNLNFSPIKRNGTGFRLDSNFKNLKINDNYDTEADLESRKFDDGNYDNNSNNNDINDITDDGNNDEEEEEEEVEEAILSSPIIRKRIDRSNIFKELDNH